MMLRGVREAGHFTVGTLLCVGASVLRALQHYGDRTRACAMMIPSATQKYRGLRWMGEQWWVGRLALPA